MSKESEVIDPAGRCVHDRIERIRTEAGYTDRWLCVDCHEEFYHLDFSNYRAKIQVMEPVKTLRDEFAIGALSGMLANTLMNLPPTKRELATISYEWATAMLEARK